MEEKRQPHRGTFLTQDSYEGEEDSPLSQNGYTYVENNPINHTDPTGHKKKLFSGAINSAAKKVVNSFKRTASSIYRGAGIIANMVRVSRSIYMGARVVSNMMYRVKQTVKSIYKGAAVAGFVAIARQAAAQTAKRLIQLKLEYAKATGNKGTPKIKEAMNLAKNYSKSLMERLTKFCSTPKKATKTQTAKEKEKEQLERAFGRAENGKYFVSWAGPGGQGVRQHIND